MIPLKKTLLFCQFWNGVTFACTLSCNLSKLIVKFSWKKFARNKSFANQILLSKSDVSFFDWPLSVCLQYRDQYFANTGKMLRAVGATDRFAHLWMKQEKSLYRYVYEGKLVWSTINTLIDFESQDNWLP